MTTYVEWLFALLCETILDAHHLLPVLYRAAELRFFRTSVEVVSEVLIDSKFFLHALQLSSHVPFGAPLLLQLLLLNQFLRLLFCGYRSDIGRWCHCTAQGEGLDGEADFLVGGYLPFVACQDLQFWRLAVRLLLDLCALPLLAFAYADTLVLDQLSTCIRCRCALACAPISLFRFCCLILASTSLEWWLYRFAFLARTFLTQTSAWLRVASTDCGSIPS